MTWDRPYHFLYELLVKSQSVRDLLPGDNAGNPDWILYERIQMTLGVNRRRIALGKDPISSEEVARKEQLAAGHIDYTKKYALGCEELVLAD